MFAPSELPIGVLEQAELQGVPQNEIHGVLHFCDVGDCSRLDKQSEKIKRFCGALVGHLLKENANNSQHTRI